MCGNFHRQYAYLYSLDVGVGRVEQQQAHDVFEPLAHSLDQRGHAALREGCFAVPHYPQNSTVFEIASRILLGLVRTLVRVFTLAPLCSSSWATANIP